MKKPILHSTLFCLLAALAFQFSGCTSFKDSSGDQNNKPEQSSQQFSQPIFYNIPGISPATIDAGLPVRYADSNGNTFCSFNYLYPFNPLVTAIQSGNDNTALVDFNYYYRNALSITQDSSSNILRSTFTGDHNKAEFVQHGNNNDLTSIQHSNSSVKVNQTGNGNSVTIKQQRPKVSQPSNN